MLDNKYVRKNVTRTNVLKQMHKNKFLRKKFCFTKNHNNQDEGEGGPVCSTVDCPCDGIGAECVI
jgi:hypothetical protein